MGPCELIGAAALATRALQPARILNLIDAGGSDTTDKAERNVVSVLYYASTGRLTAGRLAAIRQFLLTAVLSLLPFVCSAELAFTLDEIQLEQHTDVRIMALPATRGATPALVLLESDDDDVRFLSMYSQTDGWKRDYRIELGSNMQLFDVGRLGPRPYLIAYASPELLLLEPKSGRFERLLRIESYFRGKVESRLYDAELVRDLNGDGLDDIMIPHFDGWQVAIQIAGGAFTEPQSVGPPPLMTVGTGRYVGFGAPEAFLMDHNRDGRMDLAFWVDGDFLVHHRREDGRYVEEPATFSPEIVGMSDSQSLVMGVGGRSDNSEREEKVLSVVEDLNGDGIVDLLLLVVEVDGLFGTETRIEVHTGSADPQGELAFAAVPDSVIVSSSIQFGTEREDIDGDGVAEMMITSVKVTLGAVVRALLARTVALDVGIYRMVDGRYPADPDIKRKITAKLDFANGDISIPAVVVADVTGDGLKDLLVQDGPDELDVFLGSGTDELFARRPVEVGLRLPGTMADTGYDIQVVDLDGDGRDELLMLFAADDEPVRVVTVRFHDQTP